MAIIPQLDRLQAQLLTSGLSQKNNALYQVIDQLIKALRQGIDEVDSSITGGGSGGGGGLLNQSFLTINNDLATLVNSRRLLAGFGITFDDSIGGIRTIATDGNGDHVPMSTGAEP